MALFDVFIGLSFTYVLLSLFTSIIQELISGLSSLRGRIVIQLLARLLGFEGTRERALFKVFLEKKSRTYQRLINSNIWIKRYPSYLSSNQVIDIVQDLYRNQEVVEPKADMSNSKWWFNWVYNGILNQKRNAIDYLFKWEICKRILRGLFRSQDKKFWITENSDWFEEKLKPKNFKNRNLRNVLTILKDDLDSNIVITETDVANAKRDFLVFYDDYTDRAKGWFKRKVQLNLIIIGFLIAFFTNANTIQIYNKLSNDPLARDNVVKLAETFVNNDVIEVFNWNSADSFQVKELQKEYITLMESGLNPVSTNLGLGWDTTLLKVNSQDHFLDFPFIDFPFIDAAPTLIDAPFIISKRIIKKIGWNPIVYIGFLLTALAVSLGANFWFDLLVLLINIRNTGRRPKALATKNNLAKNTSEQKEVEIKIVG